MLDDANVGVRALGGRLGHRLSRGGRGGGRVRGRGLRHFRGGHHAAHGLRGVDDASAGEVDAWPALTQEQEDSNGGHQHKRTDGDEDGTDVAVVAVAQGLVVRVGGVLNLIGWRHQHHVDDVDHAVGSLDVRERDVGAVEDGAIADRRVVAVDHRNGQAVAEVSGHHGTSMHVVEQDVREGRLAFGCVEGGKIDA